LQENPYKAYKTLDELITEEDEATAAAALRRTAGARNR
jgi:hypothetical protein